MKKKATVLKSIVYKNPKSKRFNELVRPSDEVLDFPHLTDEQFARLCKMRVLKEATSA